MSRVRFVDQTKFNAYKVTNATTATSASYASTATSASYALTASVITGTVTSASYAITASYAISASHEIIKEISSSHANTADTAAGLTGQPSILVTNITASGDIILGDSQRIYFEADKATYAESDTTDRIRFVVGGTQMLLLDEDDDRVNIGYGMKLGVGLGNHTTPGEMLEVDGNISASGFVSASSFGAPSGVINPLTSS